MDTLDARKFIFITLTSHLTAFAVFFFYTSKLIGSHHKIRIFNQWTYSLRFIRRFTLNRCGKMQPLLFRNDWTKNKNLFFATFSVLFVRQRTKKWRRSVFMLISVCRWFCFEEHFSTGGKRNENCWIRNY